MSDFGKITPRWYQKEIHESICNHIRTSSDPAFIDATVGSGKSLSIAAICKRAQDKGMPVLVLARQSELVAQDAQECWAVGAKNSIFSASIGKSTHYPIIVATEGTCARALDNELSDFTPMIILIDEVHMVNFEDEQCQYMKIIREFQRRNEKLRIIGFTGSPFRGTDPILGDFWKKRLYQIDTETLVNEGFLVPTVFGFGHDELQYDLHEWESRGQQGAGDFTSKELVAMQRKITKDSTATHKIMHEVMELTRNRNGVLITCAGKKHCEQAAEVLPDGTWGIITDATGAKARREILDAAYKGDIKYVLQVAALTTGVNIPLWDTSVILRKIGSLTLLVQLLGRGMRLLKPHQEEAGFVKSDHLVLDYSETLHEMAGLYHNPILEKAEAARAKDRKEEKICPVCETMNSEYARRCIGDNNGSRCEHFWQSIVCTKCETENDIVARECRNCGEALKDPNANLSGKHYTDDELTKVLSMKLATCKNGALRVNYSLEDGREPVLFFRPDGGNNPMMNKRIWFNNFVKHHVQSDEFRKKFRSMCDPAQIVKMQAMFDVPEFISARFNEEKKNWNIGRRVFRSGRAAEG